MSEFSLSLRRFNRFELKYVITLKQADDFKQSILPYLQPDQYGEGNGRYKISSLYYDSPDLQCYWEKEYGIRVRRKLRIRHYGESESLMEESPVFLEIKQRVDKVTQKRRIKLPYGDALRLCNDRSFPSEYQAERPVIEEAYAFIWHYNLQPTSIVRYVRQAFVGTQHDPGLRLTFDGQLSSQYYPLDLREDTSGFDLIDPNRIIMEIKVNERMPYWLSELIAKHNLSLVRISKYCRSIDAAKNMPYALWRNLPSQRSEELMALPLSK